MMAHMTFGDDARGAISITGLLSRANTDFTLYTPRRGLQ